jgi:tetratricopeptide (TPR) repeat protein
MVSLSLTGYPQPPSPQAAAKPDYSQEAYVIEQMLTKVNFDNVGNRTREQTTRVQVKTDAGIQQWGVLLIPFQSAVETAEVVYVRVRKPDESTVSTSADNIKDLDAQITRDAPFYSDLREKHIAVKGLGKGDVLEYQVRWRPIKPLIPGQFWFDYNFQRDGIVLDERLEIRTPADRVVKFKGPQGTQTVSTEAGSRVFTWTFARVQSAKEPQTDKKRVEATRGLLPAPDVQFSSFQTWEEVGEWYWNLQKDRIKPSAAIRAKAVELTKGLTDEAAKLEALYSFVSIQYRYIGIAFGIGRYQPHAADDVLSNNYGDCKDKHTLLAALLQASGITLYPALISSARKLDPDVPSPGQFDHIIGYLPQGKTAVWLDTTLEVAPFGFLVSILRDKNALVIKGENSAQLLTTPAEPPFPGLQSFKIEGKLNDDGSFSAQVQDASRGDGEVMLRSAFRRIPQPQWKDLVQQISYSLGYAGTVSDVNASAPDLIEEPFHFSYSYTRKDYPDWANHQFTVPGHPFYMLQVKDDATDPVWLGAFLETVSESKIELPKGFTPKLPLNVDLKYDFAEYHATYSQDQGTLSAKRRLLIKMHEVPAAELDDYRSFVKNMQNDVNRYVQTSSIVGFQGPSTSGAVPPLIPEIRNLPDSTSPEANRLEMEGRTTLGKGDLSSAASAFKRAVDADPKFTRAWMELAIAYINQRQNDAALDAFRLAVDSDPKVVLAHRMYASWLTYMGRREAALQAWQDEIKLAPDDPDANSNIASLLMQDKRYADALPYLESVAKTDTSPPSQIRLGSAYLRSGQTEKGIATLQQVLDTDSKPVTLNNIAYELAEADISLPKALEYARRAVDEQEKRSSDMELSNLLQEDLACTQKIGMFWDTLGWVEFRLGQLDQAESYLHAAWVLTQTAIVADHLGQVYEQEQKKNQAIHMYRLALATPYGHSGALDQTRQRLEHLGVKMSSPTSPVNMDRSADELSQLRSFKLKPLIPGTATAEFFLLFSPGKKLEDVQFISGSEQLKSARDALFDANFQVLFPTGSAARLVRRAIVMCSPISGCNAVLYTPSSVNSVN